MFYSINGEKVVVIIHVDTGIRLITWGEKTCQSFVATH